MNSFLRRAAVVCGTALFVFSLPIAHMTPTALAAPLNPNINAAGEWDRPGPGFVGHETGAPGEDIYIIRHQAPPLALYRGDIPGLAPTSPSVTGAARLDTDSSASLAYLAYVAELHADMVAAIEDKLGRGALEVVHRYDAAINGIAVRMTAAEAQQISTLPGIRSITRDYSRKLLTDNGPKWIGAQAIWGAAPPSDDSTPAWCAAGNCGEGVVTGIIDTGVNFNHPSFAEVGGDGYTHTNPRTLPSGAPRYYGKCATVVGICNDKLIGYYDFTGTGPEDDNGHGSHTASTTAGNVLNITLEGNTINVDRSISGVAPHANIISYKGCSGTPVGCLLSALLGAINQATLDEVDVINYSIGGSSSNPWADLDAQAFLGAYNAGIFVATSASNDGPGFATLGSPADAPWVTSVGASTHNRKLANGVVGMTGGISPPADITGKGITSGAGPAPIVYAGDYPSDETSTPELCGAGTGDPATGEGTGGSPWTGQGNIFAGKIVVCDRGEYGRVAKGGYVKEHGAIGYILANDAGNGDSLVADNHVLPGVHITHADGLVLKDWLADGGTNHTGNIAGLTPGVDNAAADVMASFSSRGANPAAPSLIKPDVTAPGVDILAAWMADPAVTAQDVLLQTSDGEQYNIISGTSMSSPHTAGAGALIRAVHPTWSPDEVKSALMTTAFTTMANGNNGDEMHGVLKEDASTPADPFDMGAGRVDLHVATQAGFVLDVGVNAGIYEAANPGAEGDVTTLNIASLGNADCGLQNEAETCSWDRTLKGTNGGGSWNISFTNPAGAILSVTESGTPITSLTLADGQIKTLTFTADVKNSPKTAPNGGWLFGEVRFTSTSAAPDAHFPVAVIPNDFGGNSTGLKLFFHGNPHDNGNPEGCTYSGVGSADVDIFTGCGPFMSTDPQLDPDAPSAKFTWSSLNSGAAQTPLDPNWIWRLTEETKLLGNMSIEFWASSSYVIGDVGVDIELFADGQSVQVWENQRFSFSTPNVPQLQKINLAVNEVTATESFVLKIESRFIDTGQSFVVYYDSEESCTTQSTGPCDSRATMPVVTGALPPVAIDDEVFMMTGHDVVVDVLANDDDPDGDKNVLAVEIITQPSHGTASVTSGNGIYYQHDSSATASDTLVYRITDVQGLTATASVNFTIADGCYVAAGGYSDDFESGAPGWTVDTDTNLNPLSQTWQLTTDLTAPSLTTTWFTDSLGFDPSAALTKDDRLVSPAQLVSADTHLTFWHKFHTEDTYDGGVLEISIDNGVTWVDVLDAAGRDAFVKGNYNSKITQPNGRRGWGGLSPSWSEVEVDLGRLAGKTIKVRFRMLQDNNVGGAGWWVDDVTFSNLLEACPSQPPVAYDDTDTVDAAGSVITDVKANDQDVDTPHENLTVTKIVTPPMYGTAVIVGTDMVEYSQDGNSAITDSYEYEVSDPEGNSATAWVNIDIVQPVCAGDDGSSDDDDYDDDCQRDDEDSDDDNDGTHDDYDNDDDNDGVSDDSDSDDDNDGIDDEFDQESTKESQTKSSSQAAANSESSHSSNSAPGTLAFIALVETAPTANATVEIRDPNGAVVATAATVAGRAVATTVPLSSGNYTVKVLNPSSTPLDYQLTIIKRVNW